MVTTVAFVKFQFLSFLLLLYFGHLPVCICGARAPPTLLSPIVSYSDAQKIWHSFQKFSRKHESTVSSKDWNDECNKLQLDSDLAMHVGVDVARLTDSTNASGTSSGKRKKRVLFLATIRGLFLMLDRWQFHTYLALCRSELFEVTLWGIGMPGFSYHETTDQNIRRWFQDPRFDIIFTTWIYNQNIRGELNTDPKTSSNQRSSEFSSLPGNPIVVTVAQEIAFQNSERFVRPNILFTVYEQFLGVDMTVDMCGSVRRSGCPMNDAFARLIHENPQTMLAYMPHGVETSLFDNANLVPETNKSHKVLLVGSTYKHLYPLRAAGL